MTEEKRDLQEDNIDDEPREEPSQAENSLTSPLGERLSDVADKGVKVFRDVFQKVSSLAGEASDITRLKLDIAKLKGKRDDAYAELGKKYWSLHKQNQLKGIKTTFGAEFQQLQELEEAIAAREEQASGMSLGDSLRSKSNDE